VRGIGPCRQRPVAPARKISSDKDSLGEGKAASGGALRAWSARLCASCPADVHAWLAIGTSEGLRVVPGWYRAAESIVGASLALAVGSCAVVAVPVAWRPTARGESPRLAAKVRGRSGRCPTQGQDRAPEASASARVLPRREIRWHDDPAKNKLKQQVQVLISPRSLAESLPRSLRRRVTTVTTERAHLTHDFGFDLASLRWRWLEGDPDARAVKGRRSTPRERGGDSSRANRRAFCSTSAAGIPLGLEGVARHPRRRWFAASSLRHGVSERALPRVDVALCKAVERSPTPRVVPSGNASARHQR